jgi:hypothetical protein
MITATTAMRTNASASFCFVVSQLHDGGNILGYCFRIWGGKEFKVPPARRDKKVKSTDDFV